MIRNILLSVVSIAIVAEGADPLPDIVQHRLNMQLWRAAFLGDTRGINYWAGEGAQLETRAMANTTPLIVAANNNRTDAVKMLLDLGANINAQDFWGFTALVRAALHSPTADLLLSRGANVSTVDWKGDTALMDAAMIGASSTVRQMIDRGADVNAKNKNNSATALTYAAMFGFKDIVQTLLLKGAERAGTLDGQTALHKAAENGHYQVVDLLLDVKADPNQVDAKGWTPLMLAAKYKRYDVLSVLIGRGAKVDMKNTDDGSTALMMAAASGSNISVSMLLERSPDVTITDNPPHGWTALDYAIREGGKVAVVQTLLNRGSSVSERDLQGKTPLFHAAAVADIANTDILQTLLQSSADVNAVDTNGGTPLMEAAARGSTPKLKMLLDANANINAKNADGMTALMYAAKGGYLNATSYLLDRGANINANRSDGFTPLMVAVDSGKTDIVNLLMSKKPDTTVKDVNGMTAADIAGVKNFPCIVEIITGIYRNPSARNNTDERVTQRTPCLHNYDY